MSVSASERNPGNQTFIAIPGHDVTVSSETASSSKPASSSSDPLAKEKEKTAERVLDILVYEFDEMIVSHLDRRAREAIMKQEKIEDARVFGNVKRAIEDRILELLLESTTSVPKLKFFTEIVRILGTRYPYMYHSDPTKEIGGNVVRMFLTRGTGGVHGLSSLPKVLKQKFQRMVDKQSGRATVSAGAKRKQNEEEPDCPPVKKRRAFVYGVNQEKFHAKGNNREELFEALEGVNDVHEREKIFQNFRETIQELIRSSKDISVAVPGFFVDPVHVEGQFVWLCNRSITGTITAESEKQLRHLEKILEVWRPYREYEQKLEAARVKSALHGGSSLPLRVCWIRELNLHWHKTREGLFRYPEEEECDSPHFTITEQSDRMSFDIRVERKVLFSGLNFEEAVAAYFHLCFVANLKYPEKGESVAIWLQRRIAGIVDKGNLANYLETKYGKVTV